MNSASSRIRKGLTTIILLGFSITLMTPSVFSESWAERKIRQAREKIERRMRTEEPTPVATPIAEAPAVEVAIPEVTTPETSITEVSAPETPLTNTANQVELKNESQQIPAINAAKLAEDSCIKAGEEDKAAKIALLFTTEYTDESLVSKDVSSYLVGLCVPKDFNSQYSLNQFLVSKGSAYSFYSERSLEELAEYLDKSGIELSVKIDALKKDSKLQKELKKANDIEKAEYLLNQGHHYSENIDQFLPAIGKLKEEQKKEALEIAARARAHSSRSTFFLARSLYVSEKMAGTMMENAKIEYKENESTIKKLRDEKDGRLKISILDDGISWLRGRNKKEKSKLQLFTKFATDNAEVLSETLSSSIGIVRTFDTEASEVPTLSDKVLEEDVQRLNEEWDFPAEFADEGAYDETNQYATS